MVKLKKIASEGDPVDIEISSAEQKVIKLKTTVQTISGEDRISVNAPIYKGHIFPVEVDSTVSVFLPQDAAGIYTFFAKVIARKEINKVPTLVLKKTSKIKKSQRRQFFRLDFVGDINIKMDSIPEENQKYLREMPRASSKIVIVKGEGLQEAAYFSMQGKDLSGGGFKAIGRAPISEGTQIAGLMILNEDPIPFAGKVVRCVRTNDTVESYEIGVGFLDMDDSLRSKIVGFIFERQRRMRKKGLI